MRIASLLDLAHSRECAARSPGGPPPTAPLQHPEGAEAVIQTITAAINATLSPPDDPVTPPHS